jgi:voltage-gated potassium channel
MGSIRQELHQLFSWEAHHRRLLARVTILVSLTAFLDLCGAVAVYFAERHAAGTEITSFGDALFFATVQLLTVSSQLRNPLTTMGRVIDVLLELWAVLVVAGAAGAIAAFFQTADTSR